MSPAAPQNAESRPGLFPSTTGSTRLAVAVHVSEATSSRAGGHTAFFCIGELVRIRGYEQPLAKAGCSGPKDYITGCSNRWREGDQDESCAFG